MAVKYCDHCDRVVTAKRKIGVGTLILSIITGGLWLLIIPFYSKRCPICLGTSLSNKKAQ
jgi:RNA polymerase subunit RPABC4/transcription elongation factor Spt4